MLRFFLVILTLLAMLSCTKEPTKPQTPEAAYVEFATALRGKDPRAAYKMLSEPTRAAIEARTKQIVQAAPGIVKDDPAVIALQSGLAPREMGTPVVVETFDGGVVVEVGEDSRRTRVRMLQEERAEGRVWSVDLADSNVK